MIWKTNLKVMENN